ncbi:MAG: ACP S-malonyltransferase [Candidatus Marinimicrobia bacterium]|nr:ACP S-malonyltransferase [Candidatus Neomarinimicrobiota bacterium]MBL7059414.1 ACP S-malonyltransferase [Candidatus Neomarinimicrobiota bacterium]
MKSAFIFPGQASQKVGMGFDLYENTDIGKQLFEQANDIMDTDIQDIIFNGPEDVLKQTQYTQPAIYIVSVILGKLLLNYGHAPSAVAGHSLGEYSALAVADAFDFVSGLQLVKVRAESMQKAGEQNRGTMAAVIGLGDDILLSVCEQCQGIVIPANYNAPGQIVISGEVDAVHVAMRKAKDAGARKVIELNVSGAFHSPLMSPAREALAEMVKSIEIRESKFPVFSNVTGLAVSSGDDIRKNLIEQLESPVLWQDSILNMHQDGIIRFVEVGPGRVLQGLNRRIERSLKTTGVEKFTQIMDFEYV